MAFAGGYTDQAHFSREVRELSGQTPSELAAQRLPESGEMLPQTGTEHFDETAPCSRAKLYDALR